MIYIVSEYAQITGKWIQLISRSVNIMVVSQSVSVLNQTAVCFLHPVKIYDDDKHRQRIDKFYFLLLLKIQVGLYDFF